MKSIVAVVALIVSALVAGCSGGAEPVESQTQAAGADAGDVVTYQPIPAAQMQCPAGERGCPLGPQGWSCHQDEYSCAPVASACPAPVMTCTVWNGVHGPGSNRPDLTWTLTQ